MAEIDKSYASKGVAGTGLGLGIAGTALGLMAGGLGGNAGGIFGGAAACSEDHTVNRYELDLKFSNAAKDSHIALLESNIYTDSKIADVFERLSTRINLDNARQSEINTQQAVYNATNTAGIACLKGQVNELMTLTKLVVPSSNVCSTQPHVVVANTECNPVITKAVSI